jgi:hypothetical protein
MNFSRGCIADDGTGQRKAYLMDGDYMYLFDTGSNDNGSAINAYWTSKRIDLGDIPTLKRMYFTELITNSASFSLTEQHRQDWETSWSTAESLIDNTNKHTLVLDRLGNLIQYKLADNSSDTAFEISRLALVAEGIGVSG